MRKQKKLTLSRETLHLLSRPALQGAPGGTAYTFPLGTGCECSYTDCSIDCFKDSLCQC
jgi:hypothetical protein